MEKQNQHANETVDLIKYGKVLYKNRGIIFTVIVSTMFLTTIFCFVKPKVYEASTSFYTIEVFEKEKYRNILFDIKRRADIENVIISLLESRKMADKIIEQLNLNSVLEKAFSKDSRALLKDISKFAIERSGIIRVSVRYKSADLAAKIANTYVDNLDHFNSQLDIESQKQIIQIIDVAMPPDDSMPRGTIRNTIIAGIIASILVVFLVFLRSAFKSFNIFQIIKEK